MDGWLDGLMDGWMDGWMDRWILDSQMRCMDDWLGSGCDN